VRLEDCREAYYSHSTTASEVNRNLAFAALAVVWIFRLEQTAPTLLPTALIWPTILAVLSLGLDLLQYVTSAAIWGIYTRYKERSRISGKTEFLAPRQTNWPGLAFFWGKIGSLIIAYVLLLKFLASRL